VTPSIDQIEDAIRRHLTRQQAATEFGVDFERFCYILKRDGIAWPRAGTKSVRRACLRCSKVFDGYQSQRYCCGACRSGEPASRRAHVGERDLGHDEADRMLDVLCARESFSAMLPWERHPVAWDCVVRA
jgi:hypothetical protein